ncbi:hypothetical protein [Nitrobacter hamburgensis]|uniref:hypothetical protein n=1 Tax=Nitrobacter hamburgensis TaxID=912 RepID=UPI0002D4D8BA|nr:hypothetical protein [Nitrobacter hamburgensis]
MSVRVKKTRQNKKLGAGFDSIKAGMALERVRGREGGAPPGLVGYALYRAWGRIGYRNHGRQVFIDVG